MVSCTRYFSSLQTHLHNEVNIVSTISWCLSWEGFHWIQIATDYKTHLFFMPPSGQGSNNNNVNSTITQSYHLEIFYSFLDIQFYHNSCIYKKESVSNIKLVKVFLKLFHTQSLTLLNYLLTKNHWYLHFFPWHYFLLLRELVMQQFLESTSLLLVFCIQSCCCPLYKVWSWCLLDLTITC